MRRPDDPSSDLPPHRDSSVPPSDRSRQPKRERSAALTQERILDSAEQEFAARGFPGARLREIAVAAGVQPALIHHYFGDKQGLYEAVIGRAVEHMSTASWRVLERHTDLEGLVRGFVDVMVDFSVTHHNLLAIMRAEVLSGAGMLVDIIREKSRPILQAVVAVAAKLQDNGQLRKDVAPSEMVRSGLSLILYPAVDGSVLEALLPEVDPSKTVERRKNVVAALLLRGLAP
ncbi:MAG: TetR/AcrR family transcriptional regulator [Myxococcales bacterium]|nr:TetR/AcrR family transcriptional regulator [Myxococcales bacterium]